jgi:hypothetical protein
MSNTVRDLRCVDHPEEHYECSVFYKLSDGPPDCPKCGAARVPFYATREMEGKAAREHVDPTLAGFTSVKYDGEWRSRAELEAIKNAYADRQGVPRESLEFTTMGNKSERADFHRHRAYETRRSVGYDTQQFKEHQREQLRQH